MTTIDAKSFEEARATHLDPKADKNLAEHKSEQGLLNRALYASASVHQPHGLKAFLAAQSLAIHFDEMVLSEAGQRLLSQQTLQNLNIWQHTSDLIGQSDIQVEGLMTPKVLASDFSEFRIKKVLDLAIYPAAYQAMYQWYQHKGFADVFAHYLDIATSNHEYLSHSVTILLAFNRLYPQLDARQVMPFLERFTEFVTSSFAGKRQISLAMNETHQVSQTYDFKAVLKVCLQQPSFFGHNLITLSWIMRSKAEFNEAQLEGMTKNLYQQATNPLDDPEDELDKGLFAKSLSSESQEIFELSLKHLVFKQCHNLHQVTLADALAFLFLSFPQEKANISRIADYYVRVFASE